MRTPERNSFAVYAVVPIGPLLGRGIEGTIMSDNTLRIEDYAMIGDTHTAALVGRNGSIDWLCLPRFDAPACFARLLGSEENGYWRIAPTQEVRQCSRRYRPGTLILETEFTTESGTVRIVDFMPTPNAGDRVELVRLVQGLQGAVSMRMDVAIRFDYGRIVPWVRGRDFGLQAIAGPDAIEIRRRSPCTARISARSPISASSKARKCRSC